MKSIKYIFATILLLLGASYANAQIEYGCWESDSINGNKPYRICWYVNASATVNTPNGNPVQVFQWYSDDWTTSQKNDLKNAYMSAYSGLTFESEATAKYNCHAYAWAGGTTYWMNPPNQAQYWNDYSYVKITSTPPAGAKVRYLSSDHSAVTTATSGEFSSKWGAGPRFKHPINQSPFTADSLEYYIRPVTISGFGFDPNLICQGSSKTFTASNWQAGYYWDKSTNLSLSSPTSATTTVSAANFSSQGDAWLSVKESSGVELAKNNLIWIGEPSFYVSGNKFPMTGGYYPYYVLRNGNSMHTQISQYDWQSVSGTDMILYPSFGEYAEIMFYDPGYYNIVARGCNSCGWSEWAVLEVEVNYSPSPSGTAYPNPVNDILTVEIENQAANYDIRLYDINGAIRRQATSKGNNVEFNVSNLPNGIYSLHIYDGTNNKPEMQTIIVQH